MLKGNGIGNVGGEPDLKTFENGNKVVKFNVAFNRSYKKGDEWQNETTWMTCQAWGAKADKVMQQVTKGCQVFVEGVVSQNDWQTKEGETRKSYVMNIDRFAVCVRPEKKSDGGNSTTTKKAEPQAETVPATDDNDTPF